MSNTGYGLTAIGMQVMQGFFIGVRASVQMIHLSGLPREAYLRMNQLLIKRNPSE